MLGLAAEHGYYTRAPGAGNTWEVDDGGLGEGAVAEWMEVVVPMMDQYT